MDDSPDHVVERNPAHVLASVPDDPADAHLEGGEHLRQRPARRAEYNAGAEVDDTDSHLPRGFCCRLPRAANFGQKARTGEALFVQDFVAAIAVVSNGGGADQDLRGRGQRRERLGQDPSPLGSADSDPGFLLGRPPASGNVLSRQTSGLDCATLRVPVDLPRLRVHPHKPRDAVTSSREKRDQRRADEPARPANQNLHVRASSVWV